MRVCVCVWALPIKSSERRERSKQRQMWEQALWQEPPSQPSDVDAAFPVWLRSLHTVGVWSCTCRCVSVCVQCHSVRGCGEFRGHLALWCIQQRKGETMKQQDMGPHVNLWSCVYMSMWGCDCVFPCVPVDMWEPGCSDGQERSAASVTLSLECTGSVHLEQGVTVSLRLGDKVIQRHLYSQDGYLFHRVIMSQSAHQPCIFIDFWPHCKPSHRVWSRTLHYDNVLLRTWASQPPFTQLIPIKSRVESKLLAGSLFLDFTHCSNIYFMSEQNYKTNCWLVNVHCKLASVRSSKDGFSERKENPLCTVFFFKKFVRIPCFWCLKRPAEWWVCRSLNNLALAVCPRHNLAKYVAAT